MDARNGHSIGLTDMIERLATEDVIPTAASVTLQGNTITGSSLRPVQHTPSKSARFAPDSAFSTPHKETDDPSWSRRDVPLTQSVDGTLDMRSSPRYPSGIHLSPRRASRVASSRIDEHIYYRGFLEGACSDVAITAFGKTYALHRIILDRAPFFNMMFSGPWKDADSSAMALQFDDENITRPAFEAALARVYGKETSPETVDTLSLLATAAYIDLEELQEECTVRQLRSLNTSTLGKVVSFVSGTSDYGSASERLREACRALLLRDGYEMTMEDWDEVPDGLAADILMHDAFFCPAEIDRYNVIASLLRHRKTKGQDVFVFEQLLASKIHYMHMTQSELKKIKSDGLVDENVLFKALWDQVELKEYITIGNGPVLGITTKEETEYPVPRDETSYIGDPALTPTSAIHSPSGPLKPAEAHSLFPPFRFSAEFERVGDLKEDTRVYSHTVFYAGSYWNIYIHNKIRARKARQLGVYLHRVEIKAGEGNGFERSSFDYQQDLQGHAYMDTHVTPNGSPMKKDAQGIALTMPDVKRPYVDMRSTISTFFKIYCPARKGSAKIGVTEFQSAPDEFNRSQSWGWKSRGLCSFDDREGEGEDMEQSPLKFMVCLGLV
ncbi:hypothetical protein BCR37DRAFT_399600 [Protomyces lactucae-debilis]|uniref:BTB domain-containing protein n=1 Tax=Protomyces lactucae-debilis TaxID=2754530 RepID=A0A1Y2F909_PROLT|nr:uncharacterized protein BCR37DRAFT_399600 [Protomyces lactucae-debilis]ORY79826.1 hypothetical protein BCR37DRAFT_399600 [Protomyces lactucae-debilis]